ncbi:rod shape-determining protein MreC [Aliiglaciecola sp. CAU 1673]|uniref:rod shape-determining protein MreC n=1 Tax=Aliiglaciecola sp. CAU 1673 TaxID=3032595 RepID=UPI0023DC7431|nr:rod shape-determining protein MreC [Aliiglaciecola sp. CAU 1673]MDF2179127.1 rod shape-determining protein MreC [Aliiglaciecola sp. CAU 1673]
MDTIFTRGPSLVSRLVLASLTSLLLILLDHRLDSFSKARLYLNSLVSPLQYMASLPGDMLNQASSALTTQSQLLERNARLTHQNILLSEQLQRFEMIKLENDKLRTLLGSTVRPGVRKMVAELMAVDNNPYSHQIMVDKGSLHGVFEGQPVLDDKGVVGQVMEVGTTTSRVLLIADLTHGIPVRILRNNVRMVASGSGQLNQLILNHVPHSTDVQEGDILVSSGLGEVFPEGYPVGKVTSVLRDESRPFAQVKAEPIAQLDRLKYLLLLWPADAPSEPQLQQDEAVEP